MKHLAIAGMIAGAILTTSVSMASAATITFGSSNIDRLDVAGVQVEDGFQFEAVVGTGWEITDNRTTSNSHLTTFNNGEASAVDDAVEFRPVNGGLFLFNSVD